MRLCTIVTPQAQVACLYLPDYVSVIKVPASWSVAMCTLLDIGALWTSHAGCHHLDGPVLLGRTGHRHRQ